MSKMLFDLVVHSYNADIEEMDEEPLSSHPTHHGGASLWKVKMF